MKKKQSSYLVVIAVLIATGSFFSFNSSPIKTKLKYELGFSINPSVNSSAVTYVILGIDSITDKIISKKPISEGQFVMFSKGIYKCEANPKRINFFEEQGIDCGLILDDPRMEGHGGNEIMFLDTMWEEMKPICLPVWDIWKLRYSIHPRYGSGASAVPEEDKGWAANRHRPSYKQTLYLQKYGIKQIQDYFHGPKIYELFKDMQNPDWVNMYMELH